MDYFQGLSAEAICYAMGTHFLYQLWNTFHAPEDVEPALDDSLKKLGTDYLDLYLIHWPIAFKKGTTEYDPELTANPYPTWQKLEEMVTKGKVRNIGISK